MNVMFSGLMLNWREPGVDALACNQQTLAGVFEVQQNESNKVCVSTDPTANASGANCAVWVLISKMCKYKCYGGCL